MFLLFIGCRPRPPKAAQVVEAQATCLAQEDFVEYYMDRPLNYKLDGSHLGMFCYFYIIPLKFAKF